MVLDRIKSWFFPEPMTVEELEELNREKDAFYGNHSPPIAPKTGKCSECLVDGIEICSKCGICGSCKENHYACLR